MSETCQFCDGPEIEQSDCEGDAWHCTDCREWCNECSGTGWT